MVRKLYVVVIYLIMVDIFLCDDKVMIWIQHPEVENFFRYLGNQSGFFSSMKTLRRAEKEKLCAATITVFTLVADHKELFPSSSVQDNTGFPLTARHQKSKMLYPVIYPDRFKNAQTYCKNILDEPQDYVNVSVNVEGELFITDALPCIKYENHTWYIASGFVHDIYFTVETGPEDITCTLTGILEPLPSAVRYCCDSVDKLEKKFLAGQRQVALTKKRTSLCKLDALHKFRLCSTVYVTWRNRQPGLGSTWYPIKDVDHIKTCKSDVHLSSAHGQNQLDETLVDMVPCAVEKSSSEPDFYLTADESNLRSVFVIIATEDKDSGKIKFLLNMHISDVGALTNATCDDLMVETFHKD